MFEKLSEGFRNARLKLQGKARLTEENVAGALDDVRTSLLDADVELGVVSAFLAAMTERCKGEVVPLKAKTDHGVRVTPYDHFIKVCHEELVGLMGEAGTLALRGSPAVVLIVGLQGSGKTTTAGKLARRLQEQGRKPMLVAADVTRPAAIDQLLTLGRKIDVPVMSIRGMGPVDLCRTAVAQARSVGRDVVICDTAGRLAIDGALMRELEEIRGAIEPSDVLFVCDAMIGQDAVRTAAEFDRRLGFTAFILTKLDGDARGGAALSIREVTGKPIAFLGTGEGLDKLDEFRAEGLADRILGFGDVVGLMSDFEKVVDEEQAEADARRMLEGSFGFDDFLKQMGLLQQMGPIRGLLERMPFMGDALSQLPPEALDERELVKVKAMIQSMTPLERKRPDVLDGSRMRRVARGSGRSEPEVRDLVQRFGQVKAMMKSLGAMSGMMDALGGGGGGGASPGAGPGGMGPPFGLTRAMRRQAQREGAAMDFGGFGGFAMPDEDDDDAGLTVDEKVARARQARADRKTRRQARKKR